MAGISTAESPQVERSAPPESGRRPVTRRDLVIVAAACVLLRLPALVRAQWYNHDEATIAVQARTVVSGGRLYVDMADRKPPIPPYVYAVWRWLGAGHDPRLARLTASLLLAAAAVALVREVGREAGRSAALWTGALYVGGCFALAPADAGPANYAHFAVPLATMALLACRRAGWSTFLGGLLLGLAILSRQSWIFAVPAAGVSAWKAARGRGAARFALGLVAGVAPAAVLAPFGEFWFWTFTSSPGFVFAHLDPMRAATVAIGSASLFVAFHLVMVAGAAGTLPRSLHTDLDLWLWVATGLMATASGFRFFGHYWLQVVPPLAMLAGPAVAAWSAGARRTAGAVLAATASIAFVSLAVPSVYGVKPGAEPTAGGIRACTSPDDRVFVWGAFPELMIEIDRPIAGTLVHSDFVTGRSGGRPDGRDAPTTGAREQMMADLRTDPPVLLVDTSGVGGLYYEAFPMDGDPDLAKYVRDYERQQLGEVVLWWSRGHECPGS